MKIEDIIASKQPIKSIELEVTRELNKIRKYPFIYSALSIPTVISWTKTKRTTLTYDPFD
jgi:hypothetical protein